MAAKKKPYAGECNLKKDLFCPGMEPNLQRDSGRKGLVSLMTFNFSAGYSGQLIVYKKSATDKGLLLNHCPWCGVNLIKQMPLKENKKGAKKKVAKKKAKAAQ